MIVVYVGDVGEYLGKKCREHDPAARLISKDNFTNLKSGTYFTSIADVGDLENFSTVLRQADKIIYAPPVQWSDSKKKHSQMKQWTEDYLNVFGLRCHVENFSVNSKHDSSVILALADTRKTQQAQLWIVGSSTSHGVGVDNATRYGQLLADRLRLHASFLTAPGSAITWAADQILRSDIQNGDIVVWGLTTINRTPYYINNKLHQITSTSLVRSAIHSKLLSPETLTSDHLFYQSLTSIFQVINFCKKNNATLIVASLDDDVISHYVANTSNFIMLYHLWGRGSDSTNIDVGSDGVHPGPRSHQFYADQIYQKIQQVQRCT